MCQSHLAWIVCNHPYDCFLSRSDLQRLQVVGAHPQKRREQKQVCCVLDLALTKNKCVLRHHIYIYINNGTRPSVSLGGLDLAKRVFHRAWRFSEALEPPGVHCVEPCGGGFGQFLHSHRIVLAPDNHWNLTGNTFYLKLPTPSVQRYLYYSM